MLVLSTFFIINLFHKLKKSKKGSQRMKPRNNKSILATDSDESFNMEGKFPS